jgi:hypothetical protein
MTPYERREQMTRLLVDTPMTTAMLAERTGISKCIARADLATLHGRGLLVKAGWIGKHRAYQATRVALAEELSRRTASGAVNDSKTFTLDNIPPSLHLMFGYTEIEPQGGRKVDNEHFHPTPVRVARVKVYPGTSWANMEMAL